MEGNQGSFLQNLTRRRSCGDYIHTPVGGRLPNLVSFDSTFPGILAILSHQVGADVQGQVVEEETLEHEALSLVDSMIHGEQVTHLAHEGGRLLVSHQGLGYQSLVPLGSSMRRSLRDSSGGNSAVFHRGVLQTVLKEG